MTDACQASEGNIQKSAGIVREIQDLGVEGDSPPQRIDPQALDYR